MEPAEPILAVSAGITEATGTLAFVNVIGLDDENELVPDICADTVVTLVPSALTFTRTCETRM